MNRSNHKQGSDKPMSYNDKRQINNWINGGSYQYHYLRVVFLLNKNDMSTDIL